MNEDDESAGPSLPRRVSASDEADILWKAQYEALTKGEVMPESLEHQNLQCLDYYPLTLVIGRAFAQVGRTLKAKGEPNLGRLFVLIGRAFPYLGVRWQQSGKCRTLRLPAGRSKNSGVEKGHTDEYLSLEE